MGRTYHRLKNPMPDGYAIRDIPLKGLGWKAQYGIYLMKLVKEADKVEGVTGKFMDIKPISEEEFQLMVKGRRDPF